MKPITFLVYTTIAIIYLVLSSPDTSATTCDVCYEKYDSKKSRLEYSTCNECLLKYIENKIECGNLLIKVILENGKFGAHNYNAYAKDKIIKFLEEHDRHDLIEKLEEYEARQSHWDNNDRECIYCGAFFINPTGKKGWYPAKNTLCTNCSKHYKKPKIKGEAYAKGRFCPNCNGIIIKTQGCHSLTCGHCTTRFNWKDADKVSSQLEAECCCIIM